MNYGRIFRDVIIDKDRLHDCLTEECDSAGDDDTVGDVMRRAYERLPLFYEKSTVSEKIIKKK